MFRAFVRAPSGPAGLVIILVIGAVAVIAPVLWGDRSLVMDFAAASQNASPQHPFGTDQLGRDILQRTLVASALSLSLAISATAIGAVVGITLGLGAASLRPALRSVALRALDSLLAFPSLLVAIVVSVIVGPGALGATL